MTYDRKTDPRGKRSEGGGKRRPLTPEEKRYVEAFEKYLWAHRAENPYEAAAVAQSEMACALADMRMMRLSERQSWK